MINKLLNSAVFMTWGGLLSKLVGLILILPLILKFFPTEDIVLWYSLTSVLSIIIMFDLGFSPTFVRFYSYVLGGADISKLANLKAKHENNNNCIDSESFEFINIYIKSIYKKVSIIAFLLISIFGSIALIGPISKSSNLVEGSIAWFVIILSGIITLYGNRFTSALQALNKISLYQRYVILTTVISTSIAAILIPIYQSLLVTIICIQFGALIGVAVNYKLFKQCYLKIDIRNQGVNVKDAKFKNVRIEINKSAYKSAIGVFCSTGIFQFSNLVVANSFEKTLSSGYMIAMQLLRSLSAFSQVPISTQIPILSKLYVNGDLAVLFSKLKVITLKVLVVFLFGLLILSLGISKLFHILESDTQPPSAFVWCTLALAIGFERLFSVLVQVFSLTNEIVWDKINGMTALVVTLSTITFYNSLGIQAFSLSFFIAYVFIYSTMAVLYTRSFIENHLLKLVLFAAAFMVGLVTFIYHFIY